MASSSRQFVLLPYGLLENSIRNLNLCTAQKLNPVHFIRKAEDREKYKIKSFIMVKDQQGCEC